MKIDPQDQLKNTVEHRQVAPVQHEYHLKGSMKILPNQTLFKLNLETLVVEPVPIVKMIAELKADGSVNARNRANADPHCIYYAAYNSAQASKHFRKILNKWLQRNHPGTTTMEVKRK